MSSGAQQYIDLSLIVRAAREGQSDLQEREGERGGGGEKESEREGERER